MAINFEEISSEIEANLNPLQKTRTVLEELNARQYLVYERSIKCGNIKPFFSKIKKPPHLYNYKYVCVCPSYNPEYLCKHTNNVVIDRDILTKDEHIVHLATPKANFAAPRKMPQYFLKRTIIANTTPRIIRLAKPDKRHVTDTLNNFNNIISRRHKMSLKKCLKKSSDVEYTTITQALDLLSEENRLKRVARRNERLRCKKLERKIQEKQQKQIKKIVSVLFEEMKEFLLNDQFIMNEENSTLGTVIFEALQEFTDKEFHITNNLRQYQKILSLNLAIWINKFISNLNMHVGESDQQYFQIPQNGPAKSGQNLSTFLPVEDYISQTHDSDEEDEENYHAVTSEGTPHTSTIGI